MATKKGVNKFKSEDNSELKKNIQEGISKIEAGNKIIAETYKRNKLLVRHKAVKAELRRDEDLVMTHEQPSMTEMFKFGGTCVLVGLVLLIILRIAMAYIPELNIPIAAPGTLPTFGL